MLTSVPLDARAVAARLVAQRELRNAATRFFAWMDDERIPVAPIKGLVVAAELYDDPIERPFGDVDVLVRFRDLRRVLAGAVQRGFVVVHDSKQIGTVNVVLPPGIPIDLRCSMGPLGQTRMTAARLLARAAPTFDRRVSELPIRRLRSEDHLLVLLIDALVDKFSVTPERRAEDIRRAVHLWTPTAPEFAAAAEELCARVPAFLGLSWLATQGDDPLIAALRAAVAPRTRRDDLALRVVRDAIQRAPHGWRARISTRLASDASWRSAVALGAGALGTLAWRLRRSATPAWRDVLWRGPEAA